MFALLKKELPDLQENVLLRDHTTFKVGGPAEYFLIAEEKEKIIKAITVAKNAGLPVFLFGGGSNLVVADKGIKGLVIKIQSDDEIVVNGEHVTASAGITMEKIVSFSVNAGLKGLQWAGGLPGTFGGAIRGNAGAFGGEMKDTIFSVDALDENLHLQVLDNDHCQFSYRNSLFKQKKWIILSATVKLASGDKKTLQDIANSRIAYRKEKHPLEYPSAGSIFKNVAVSDLSEEFRALFADKVKNDPFPIVPSAWFIIGAGLAGTQIGGAQISQKHSNYIVNKGSATAKDIVELINLVKIKVKEKYGILLEPEVQFVGE